MNFFKVGAAPLLKYDGPKTKVFIILYWPILQKIVLEDVAINTYQAFIFVGRYRYIDKDGKDELIDLSLPCCFGVIHAVFGFACDGDRG